jgi:murein DD-endopeptidase MepM/ murein hydrolase activator NlpD
MMKKRARCFTIMIVPHSEEATYSLRLPLWVGQMLAAIFVIGLTGICFLFYVYRNVAQEAREARILRQINQVQQEEINAFAYETQKLLEQMAQIEDLAELVADKLGLDPDELENEGESEDGESSESRSTEVSSQVELNEGTRYYASRTAEGRVVDRAASNIATLQRLLPEQSESLELLSSEVEESLRRWAATPSIWPAWGTLTSPFGMRRSPFNRNVMEFHDGIDIAASYGSPIYATADGWVTSASYRRGWGNLLIISHGYGYTTYYAHLSGFAVSAGEWVERGDIIAYMGRSGNATGTHLHYEVRVNGTPVNPMNYIQ